MADANADAIRAAEEALYAAMIAGDIAAIEAMLTEGARYIHSNGVVETKAEYLAALAAGTYTYDRVTARNVVVQVFGDTAVAFADVDMSVGPRGGKKALVPLRSTLVWAREGGRWRLVSRHATRVPDPSTAKGAGAMSQADDKDAIRETMARYCHALDSGRFEDVAALFATDGDWTTDYDSAVGREAIAAMLTRNVPRKGEGPQRKHFITNIVIDLDGDTAQAVSDYLIIRESENGLIPVMGGTYKDRFEKRDGRWQFRRKELVHDIAGDMALKIPIETH